MFCRPRFFSFLLDCEREREMEEVESSSAMMARLFLSTAEEANLWRNQRPMPESRRQAERQEVIWRGSKNN